MLTDAEIEAEGRRRFPHWEWARQFEEYDAWLNAVKWARSKCYDYAFDHGFRAGHTQGVLDEREWWEQRTGLKSATLTDDL